jgi:hypothetical protein
MEKMVPIQQVKGAPFHKLICRQFSKSSAEQLHLPLSREVEMRYGNPGGPLASITVSYSMNPDSARYRGVRLIIDGHDGWPGMKKTRAVLVSGATSPAGVKLLKDWDTHNRLLSWATTEDTIVEFEKGRANVHGSRSEKLVYSFAFPATDIEDAVSTAKSLYAGIHFDMINSSAIAPLGEVSPLDQSGTTHPGD